MHTQVVILALSSAVICYVIVLLLVRHPHNVVKCLASRNYLDQNSTPCHLKNMTSFYINLESNVESDDLNVPSHFFNDMPNCIRLDGKWEVGLVEISYTNSWFNIPNDTDFQIVSGNKVLIDVTSPELVIPAGRYPTTNDLVETINDVVRNFTSPWMTTRPTLSYHGLTKSVTAKAGEHKNKLPLTLRFPLFIQGLLGVNSASDSDSFESNETNAITPLFTYTDSPQTSDSIKYIKVQTVSTQLGDITAGIRTLLVYSNIVDHTVVGNSFSQLLRQVAIRSNSNFGEQIVETYNTPIYVPVQPAEIKRIEILIKDDNGQDIDFKYGRTVCIVHFRKIKDE